LDEVIEDEKLASINDLMYKRRPYSTATFNRRGDQPWNACRDRHAPCRRSQSDRLTVIHPG